MRIIAGERRGHRFDGPGNSATRPTSDLVRESIFNILSDRVEGRVVFDLFAGTGALGLEAISRGAAFALFVEKDRRNAALIRRNVATLRFEGQAGVLVGDAYKWVRAFEPESTEPAVVFLDPPYRDYQDRPDRMREVLETLMGRLPAGSTVVIESDRRQEESIVPDPDLWDFRRYGGTQVAIRDLEAIDASSADQVEGPERP